LFYYAVLAIVNGNEINIITKLIIVGITFTVGMPIISIVFLILLSSSVRNNIYKNNGIIMLIIIILVTMHVEKLAFKLVGVEILGITSTIIMLKNVVSSKNNEKQPIMRKLMSDVIFMIISLLVIAFSTEDAILILI